MKLSAVVRAKKYGFHILSSFSAMAPIPEGNEVEPAPEVEDGILPEPTPETEEEVDAPGVVHLNATTSSTYNQEFVDSLDTVITDCDGVLWKSNDPLPGSAKVTAVSKAGQVV